MITCPSCGADMHFSPSNQMMLCNYCNTEISPDEFQNSQGLLTEDSTYETTIFSCPQCGGEIMSTEETAATFCSYCGSSVQLLSRIGNEKRPKKIIPFAIDTDVCSQNYKKKIGTAIFAPGHLKKDGKVDKFRGIYMPYWSYGLSLDQTIQEMAETSEREGDYIVTDHISLSADVKGSYDGISFDSASTFADDLSQQISPFVTKDAKPFNPAYMSGFYADRGDVDANVYNEDAKDYLKEEVSLKYMKLPEFEGLKLDKKKISNHIKVEEPTKAAVLYPVWFLTNKYGKDRVTYAVVNGQTGKVAADIPISPWKYIIASLVLSIPVFLLLNLLPAMEHRPFIIITTVLHIIGTLISLFQGISIEEKEKGESDKGYMSTHKNEPATTVHDFSFKKYIFHLIILIACVLLFFNITNSDYAFYACCAAVMLCVAISYIDIIRQHNILTTHKPPQLGKRGGDENA